MPGKTLHFLPRVGSWLPEDTQVLQSWLKDLIDTVDNKKKRYATEIQSPAVKEFKTLVESDGTLHMLFTAMLKQVPYKPPYNKDPTGQCQVRDYEHMFELFDHLVTQAPAYNNSELIGFPFNAVLDWPMATRAGFAAFLMERVNNQFKLMLTEWADFLKSEDSTAVLTDDPVDGWFSAEAVESIEEVAGGKFEDVFVCDSTAPHWGYTSWDDFFIRKFKDGVRPVAAQNDPRIIVNACESAPYKIQYNVQESDRFWLKAQKYSLRHMMANDEYYPQFIGGSIYQAFLSARSYHRWHSPVDGTIKKICYIPGTYYSETWAVGYFDGGEAHGTLDGAAPNDSQGYITAVATRALVFIEADYTEIGLMCFMAVGMAEVSSCEVTVEEGQHSKSRKGI